MKRFTTELKEYQQTEEYKNILAKKRSEREAAGLYTNSRGLHILNKNLGKNNKVGTITITLARPKKYPQAR